MRHRGPALMRSLSIVALAGLAACASAGGEDEGEERGEHRRGGGGGAQPQDAAIPSSASSAFTIRKYSARVCFTLRMWKSCFASPTQPKQ